MRFGAPNGIPDGLNLCCLLLDIHAFDSEQQRVMLGNLDFRTDVVSTLLRNDILVPRHAWLSLNNMVMAPNSFVIPAALETTILDEVLPLTLVLPSGLKLVVKSFDILPSFCNFDEPQETSDVNAAAVTVLTAVPATPKRDGSITEEFSNLTVSDVRSPAESVFAFPVLLYPKAKSDLKSKTSQCFGFTQQRLQCKNRRRGPHPVFCHHHYVQRRLLEHYTSTGTCLETPDWWKRYAQELLKNE